MIVYYVCVSIVQSTHLVHVIPNPIHAYDDNISSHNNHFLCHKAILKISSILTIILGVCGFNLHALLLNIYKRNLTIYMYLLILKYDTSMLIKQ